VLLEVSMTGALRGSAKTNELNLVRGGLDAEEIVSGLSVVSAVSAARQFQTDAQLRNSE
jgi:hypothetical protein